MRISRICAMGAIAAALATVAGCAGSRNDVGITNQNQPGPVVGRAVGAGVGAVAGNVAGSAVGVAEGTAAGVNSAFDNTQRVVRYWREQTTADGRVIMVPEEYLVDENGQIIRRMK